jgi:hypothetical protein
VGLSETWRCYRLVTGLSDPKRSLEALVLSMAGGDAMHTRVSDVWPVRHHFGHHLCLMDAPPLHFHVP